MDEVPESHDDNKPTNRRGRPSKWDERMVEEAYLYCLEHHGTDRDLANHLGIAYGTLYDYKAQYPEFSEAIKDGRKKYCQNGCGNAVRSLYQKVDKQFITTTKVRVKKHVNADGEMVQVERIETTETQVYMPDQRAIEFILLNKDPENWKRHYGIAIDDPVAYAEEVRKAVQNLDDLHRPAPSED